MLNKSKSVVADELLFTATNKFFKDKNKEFILEWANTCMDFVYRFPVVKGVQATRENP